MSNFTFSCPKYGQHLEAQDEWRGLTVECPICKKEIIVPKIEIAKPKPVENVARDSDSESIRKHLNYASLALQSRAFIEAEREYRAVLQEDPEHYVALYGEMLSKALQTSAANPSLGHIIFSYRKIEQILIDRNDSESRLFDLRKTFLKDFIPLIAEENTKVLNELYENKRKAEFREAVNTLNALNSRIVLSNPEAQVQQSRGEILFPYLKEILNVKYFLLGMVKISDIGNNLNLLEQCKKLCEATLDINQESPEIIFLYRQVSKVLQDEKVLELAKSRGLSVGEIKNIDLKKQLLKYNILFYFWIACLIFWGVSTIWYTCFIISAVGASHSYERDPDPPSFTIFPVVGGIFFCCCFIFAMKKERQRIKELKSQIDQNEHLK